MSTCILCSDRGKDWKGSDPKCAFETGVFSQENWNCKTMMDLREIMYDLDMYLLKDDERIGTLFISDLNYDGFIVLTWYKDRGRISNAVFISDTQVSPLTYEMAKAALEEYKDKVNN